MAKSPGVFVIDNDPDARFHVQQLVPQAGFSLSGAAGLGTVAIAQATELKPDVILCGLKEPVARVVHTIESIAHELPKTPIIVYSDSGDLETIRKAMLAGARNFLQAPLKPDDLRRSLTAALESEERRHLRAAGSALLGPRGAVMTVFGAKGGVGKTTLSANLAVALAQQARQSTMLVDVDDSFGDAAAILALASEQSVVDSIRALSGDDGDGLKELITYHDSGLAVLPAPTNPLEWKDASAERLQGLLEQLARQFDIVLVDTGSNLGDITRAALETAAVILWVTTPEYTSIRDSLQALKVLASLGLDEDRIRVILNLTTSEVEVRPSSVEEALGRPLFWTIPYDYQLRRSGQVGEALVDAHPSSPAAKSLIDLALVLSGMPVAKSNDKEGLIKQLFAGRITRTLRREQSPVLEEAQS